MLRWNAYLALLLIVCSACQSDSDAPMHEVKPDPAKVADDMRADPPGDMPVEAADELHTGVNSATDALVFRTEAVELAPGQERFLCYTGMLDEDAVIAGYSHDAQSFVHHVVFVRTMSPEPDGLSECNVLFRPSWDPLFLAGAGSSELEFPHDAGHKIARGTQLLVQLHLLNASTKTQRGPVDIVMQRSTAHEPTPVGTFVFGTTDLHLPPGQTSEVQGTCQLSQAVKLIAAFPHMHLKGRRLRFEVGSTPATMQSVFNRDPYDFDDQHAEPVDLDLAAGSYARVTCAYDNDSAQEITFGESTHNEMCFFVGFALGRERIGSCIARPLAAR